MAKYYVSYAGPSHLIHKEGCPVMKREECVYLGDFYTLTLAVPAARNLLFEEAMECMKCLVVQESGSGKTPSLFSREAKDNA